MASKYYAAGCEGRGNKYAVVSCCIQCIAQWFRIIIIAVVLWHSGCESVAQDDSAPCDGLHFVEGLFLAIFPSFCACTLLLCGLSSIY